MFIAILSVKLHIKTNVQIHKTATKYWEVIVQGLDLTPISERHLRERLKKIRHFPGKPVRRRRIHFQLFPDLPSFQSVGLPLGIFYDAELAFDKHAVIITAPMLHDLR